MEVMQAEMDTLQASHEEICLERDQHQVTIARMASEVYTIRASPASEGPKKSVKLPDPPILMDGKEPKISEWLLKMKNKLTANSDHYTTEPLKMAYIQTRTGDYTDQVRRVVAQEVPKDGALDSEFEGLTSIEQFKEAGSSRVAPLFSNSYSCLTPCISADSQSTVISL